MCDIDAVLLGGIPGRLRPHAQALSLAALYLSLLLLRVQLVRDLNLTFAEAMANRLYAGLVYDLAALAMVAALTTVASRLRAPALVVAIPCGFFLYLASLANTLHFRFFGMRLDWWIVRIHWRDLGAVKGSATDLGLTWPVLASVALLALAAFLAVWGRPAWRAPSNDLPPARRAWRYAQVPLLWLLVVFAGFRLPQWLDHEQPSVIISDQILRVWWYEWTHRRLHQGVDKGWMQRVAQAGMRDEEALAPLVRYRDLGLDDGAPQFAHEPVLEPARLAAHFADPQWPLDGVLEPDAAVTAALRERLGLPRDGPVHVIVLFVESLRALEFDDPKIGPVVFPELHALCAQHALYFRQAYSSAFTAGQTVRGQFSTLCSMLPNMGGAATYLAHTTTRVNCLQEFFRRQGYIAAWFSAYKSTFHGGRQFEALHGTTHFFDIDHFSERGITQSFNEWGLADRPVLAESLRVLNEFASTTPVFANIATLSTHHPHSVIEEGALPEGLMQETDGAPEYQGFLSRLRYADGAIASFLYDLFQSPMGERTLVVMLGDHSLPMAPAMRLKQVQKTEMRFRIPLALITRNMKSAQEIVRPVHQVDVAPTVAHVAGLGGPVSWLGRGLLAPRGSPWLFSLHDGIAYRTEERGCYPASPRSKVRCFDLRGKDPLRDTDLTEIAERPEQSQLVRDIVE
ncbi:MAG: LTA synthase family protein, partial [Deltaproteobacteria bacterium]|nr:LTA synthase family protein [Deltaproteobacteria bacterium]